MIKWLLQKNYLVGCCCSTPNKIIGEKFVIHPLIIWHRETIVFYDLVVDMS